MTRTPEQTSAYNEAYEAHVRAWMRQQYDEATKQSLLVGAHVAAHRATHGRLRDCPFITFDRLFR